MKWEYKVIEKQEISEKRSEKLNPILINKILPIDKLNQLGDDGWELVSYYRRSETRDAVVIFKRPKSQG